MCCALLPTEFLNLKTWISVACCWIRGLQTARFLSRGRHETFPSKLPHINCYVACGQYELPTSPTTQPPLNHPNHLTNHPSNHPYNRPTAGQGAHSVEEAQDKVRVHRSRARAKGHERQLHTCVGRHATRWCVRCSVGIEWELQFVLWWI